MSIASSLKAAGLAPEAAVNRTVPGADGGSMSQPAPWAGLRLRRWAALWRVFVVLRAFAVFLLVWYGLSAWNNNPLQLPSPVAVAQAFGALAADGELLDNLSVSLLRLVVSLALAVLVGVPLGFLMGLSALAERLIDPLVEILRPISGIAWIPLGLFIFGVGDTLPVFIMVYVAFFPVVLNTLAGVRGVDRKFVQAARTMGVRRRDIWLHVVAPAAMPTIVVGVRLAFAGAWAAVIAAELIGSARGLGFAVEWNRQFLLTPNVFAYIGTIAIAGFLSDLALRWLQARLSPWAHGTRLS